VIFNLWEFETETSKSNFYFIKCQKLNKSKNGFDFSSNINNARKSLAKVMNHRIEKLSSFVDANQPQSNVTNLIEISNEHEISLNEASDNNSCSSTIKVEPLSMQISKRFKSNSSIKKHKCETCKKRFLHLCHLTIHKRIHSKEKPFACDQCQMSFSTKGNLSTHKILHTGEKPYQCDLCPKKFAQLAGLTFHKRTHSGEKPYACDLCPKKFTQSNALTEHKRVHTGEKPYECGSCHKKFSDSSHFRRHKKIHS
jgi:uncharacterized Zn-finger protein